MTFDEVKARVLEIGRKDQKYNMTCMISSCRIELESELIRHQIGENTLFSWFADLYGDGKPQEWYD